LKQYQWEVVAIILIAGFLMLENNILSKKLAVIYKELTTIEFYLRDGVCPE
jgi:hypothetical protein